MPAEQIEVRHQRLSVDVVRVRCGGLSGRVQVDALRALQHLGHRQARRGLGIGGVGVDQSLVLGHGTVDVVVLEGLVSRGVARVDLLLRLVAVGGCGGGERLVP